MIIVDINILVSGLITSSPKAKTARIVDAIVAGQIRPLMSPALLDEYRAVLLRPKIGQRHGLSRDEIDLLLGAIVEHAVWREPLPINLEAPDPGDNHLWALLDAEPTATLVTGDLRLIDAPPFEARVTRLEDYEWPEH